jgi:hypothetical protein
MWVTAAVPMVAVVSMIGLIVTMRVCHVGGVKTLKVIWRFAIAAVLRISAVVAVAGIKTPIDVATEAAVAVIPTAGADERTVVEPLWAVVAVRSAVVGTVSVVAVGANWRTADADPNR